MLIGIGIAFIAGYVVCIFTWSKVKVWVNGAQKEADKLRAKADALAAAVKQA